jgi:hypothetical protein
MDALEHLYRTRKPRFIISESVVGHPAPNGDPDLAWGGRLDTILEFEDLLDEGVHYPGNSLVDYKTGGEYLESTALQLAAYSSAMGILQYDAGGMMSGYASLPEIRNRLVCYLEPNGKSRIVNPFEKLDVVWTYGTFLHLRAATNWCRVVGEIEKAAEKAAEEAERGD